ncbi:hypothetical protein LTR47_011745 [Exophiala xenobiotica]|nr:hypothetical protein LTR92_011283 [Exophiala xenobiotica]KAK5202395.1 hypothetical protein LTR41_011857 [Exophiala xenobiotica]KAK5218441.1 hypothetical protein LTR47_011745 [Exophiala xenobiotica]KAK5243315.1 hypothetical protein LTS06_010892 [Exophiala xenobiotica]KAK5260452.1 hypothetical protein LTR40_004121 [Exophiala xenobiotica]
MSEHNNNRQRGLRVVIADKSILTISDPDLLEIIKSEFPSELQRLHNATFVQDTKTPNPESPSISEMLYGKDYAKVNRTLGLVNPEDIYTLITSMVINVWGKDPNLAKDYAQEESLDIFHVSHDRILYHAVKAGMVLALDRLTEENKTCLLLGIKTWF